MLIHGEYIVTCANRNYFQIPMYTEQNITKESSMALIITIKPVTYLNSFVCNFNTKIFSYGNWSLGRGLNLVTPEYETPV